MNKKLAQSVYRKWLRHAKTSVELLIVMAEINPITSETIRLGVLFGTQAAFGNIAISAATFGGLTLIWEIAGVFAMVDLLDTKAASKVIEKVNSFIAKMGLGRLSSIETGLVADLGITLLAGTPATIILKHRQNPSRSRRDNARIGYIMSVWAAVVSAGQGAALVAGLWHPNPATVAAAFIAIVSGFGLHRWIKGRLLKGK